MTTQRNAQNEARPNLSLERDRAYNAAFWKYVVLQNENIYQRFRVQVARPLSLTLGARKYNMDATTNRQLIKLECEAMLIDTPGMRELGNFSVETGIDKTFTEIVELSEQR